MIPNPDWRKRITFPWDLASWVTSNPEASFYYFWEENINPRWFPYLAAAGGATIQQIILTVCQLARMCVHQLPNKMKGSPYTVIKAAEARSQGKINHEQMVKKARAFVTSTVVYNGTVYPTEISEAAFNAVSSAASCARNMSFRATPEYHPDKLFSPIAYAADTAQYTVRAGVSVQVIYETFRKHLPFERPKTEGLSFWQRLALEEDP